jgi:hypothetical protein
VGVLVADGVDAGVVGGGALLVGGVVVGACFVGGTVVGCAGCVAGCVGTVPTLVPVGVALPGLALTDGVAGVLVAVATAELLWTLSPVSLGGLPDVSARAMTATTAQAARPAPTATIRVLVKNEAGAGWSSGPAPGPESG